ncbi:hypothetical protein AB0A81_41260, partial [Streptomyces flaveolus]|uniref:hypothetical protein n=1 Tax=Streptomyces flaveolus TaxID=67297 RepID=UPI0033D71EA2
HPRQIDTVLAQPELLKAVIAAPAFVQVLADMADGARAALTRPQVLNLIRRTPDLAAHLVTDTALRAALTGLHGLAELLTRRPEVLDALRERPELVAALRSNRALVHEVDKRSAVWSVVSRHPLLATGLKPDVRNLLNHHRDLAQHIAHQAEELTEERAGLLVRALRSSGVPALLESRRPLAAAFLARPAWQERAVADSAFVTSVRDLAEREPARFAALLEDADPGRLLTALDGLRQRGATSAARPAAAGRAGAPAPARAAGDPVARQAAVSAVTDWVAGVDAVAELPAELTGLLAGPAGEPVAAAMAAHPELLPLLSGAPAVAEEIARHPERLGSYLFRPFLDQIVPVVDEHVLELDPAEEQQLPGPDAFDRHFDAFLESVDLALGQQHYANLKAAARHAWRAVLTDRQERLADLRLEREQRFRDFRAADRATWQHSGRIHYAGRLDAQSFTALQHGVLEGAARGEGVREVSGARKINMPLHAHLDGGSGGVAFFYALAPDGQVDMVAYAKSTGRADNNAYRWNNSGSYVPGPPSLEMVENDPVLVRSRSLVASTGADRARGGAAVPRRPSLGSAPGAAERGAIGAANALAEAVTGYWNSLRAFGTSGSKGLSAVALKAAATGLVGSGTALRALGADVFAQAWEQQPQGSRQAADALYREVLASSLTADAPMPEGSEHERGALALVHASGGRKAARAVADALAT